MSRSLIQTRTRFPTLSNPLRTRLTTSRHRSNSPEIFSGEPPAADDVEKIAMKKLEDAIHKIIVKKSQPDWIPLVPGASYWVPPKSKAQGLAKVVGNLIHNSAAAVKVDKPFHVSSNRGWPSSAFFFKGSQKTNNGSLIAESSHDSLEVETTSKHTSQSEDDEG